MTIVEALDAYIAVAEAAGRAEKTILRYTGTGTSRSRGAVRRKARIH